jgi:ABC-type multidrug transport system ATPase subunit
VRFTRQFSSVRALNDLTIEVPAGVVFGFLGPNGAGKTTTIRLLLNLIEPTSGSAEVLGFIHAPMVTKSAPGAALCFSPTRTEWYKEGKFWVPVN